MKRQRQIASVPIAAINVLNPRERNQARVKEIAKSIRDVGLKRPVTVSQRGGKYDLVCGETRIEAVASLGHADVPAIMTDASTEECILMSLIENIARRRHWPMDLLRDIGRLAKTYRAPDIAAKVGVSLEFARAVTYLLKHGQAPLISAVERGIVSPTSALEIAKAKSPKAQAILLEALLENKHTSKQVAKLRKLIEQQHRKSVTDQFSEEKINAAALVRTFKRETERQQLIAKRTDLVHAQLLFIVGALKALLSERMFASLLRSEGLDRLPLPVLRRMSGGQS